MEYAIFSVPTASVYDQPSETRSGERGCVSAISDENLYGEPCRILSRIGPWARILSHYGYAGYAREEAFTPIEKSDLLRYLTCDLGTVSPMHLDVLSLPTVQGVRLAELPAGALLRVVERDNPEGWTKVVLLDGRTGFVPSKHLEDCRRDMEFLWREPQLVLENLAQASVRKRDARGGAPGFDLQKVLDRWYGGDEGAFRAELIRLAKSYLGVQYRWAGRSGWGIDCSGLVSMAYLRSGVTIYRDAAIAPGYPIQRIPVRWNQGRFDLANLDSGILRPGDALYFPGHIAMYLGEGRYIHSTAKAGSNGVVVNSLRPEAPEFRRDLLDSLYAVGGVR